MPTVGVGKRGAAIHPSEKIDPYDVQRAREGRRGGAIEGRGSSPFVFGRVGDEARMRSAPPGSPTIRPGGQTRGCAAPAYDAGIPVNPSGTCPRRAFSSPAHRTRQAESPLDWPSGALPPPRHALSTWGLRRLVAIADRLLPRAPAHGPPRSQAAAARTHRDGPARRAGPDRRAAAAAVGRPAVTVVGPVGPASY